MNNNNNEIKKLKKQIKELKILVKHLSNELKLTKIEYDDSAKNYYDIHCNMEKIVIKRTKQAQELQEQIAKSQKMEAIGMLASGVAHDLNNILTGIICYPEIIIKRLNKNSNEYNVLTTIIDSGKKAAEIVEDMLILARRGIKNQTVININEVIEDYINSAENISLLKENTNIKLETSLNKNIPNTLGSKTHIMKSIMNLVHNAVESIKDNGVIKIETQNIYLDSPINGYSDINKGNYICLTISDTGHGISEDDKLKIFEPFYTTKIMGKSGSGLGLPIIMGVIQDVKGYIELNSIIGKGTEFKLYFPATTKKMVSKFETLNIEEYTGNNENILVIDDNDEQRKIACEVLKELKYNVTAIKNGIDAVNYLKFNKIDLVILDMIMEPNIDGLETYLKILEINPDQKSIIVNGFAKTEKVKKALNLGVGQYIQKPYTIETLGIAIKKELEK